MAVEVAPRPEVDDDLRALASDELRQEALRLLVRLRDEPDLGLRLGKRRDTGDLRGCRKLYFDEDRHRVVYRLLPTEKQPETVDVIAVGPRAEMEVYVEAVRRLEHGAREED